MFNGNKKLKCHWGPQRWDFFFFLAILALCLNLFNETQFAKGKGSRTFESWTLQSVWNCSWRIERYITAVLVSENCTFQALLWKAKDKLYPDRIAGAGSRPVGELALR